MEPMRCANCGGVAGPRYCGHCGQEQWTRRASVGKLLSELASETFSLDSKLVRTLRALLVPGRLTRLYLGGKRAPFLPPFRLYLLSGLLLFSSALALRAPRAEDVNLYVGDELVSASEPLPGALNLSLVSNDSRLARLLAERPDRLAHLRELPPQVLLDRVFSGLRAMFPAALVVVLPVLAVALKLLLMRTGALYYDHLIFALHLQSALFLTIAGAWLVTRLFGGGTPVLILACVLAFLAALVVYLPLALRRVYRLGWWGALGRTALLVVAYFWLLGLSIGVSVSLVIERI